MSSYFGPKVIDQKEYDAAQLAEKSGSKTFGSRVVDVPADVLAVIPDEPEAISYSLVELKKLLAENPAHYDDLYTAEFARADGPRPDALREFLAVEMAKPDGPDSAKLDAIEGALS